MLEHDYPVFKMQIRKLAAKRATRFGMNPTRVTLEVPEVTADRPRRISVDIDPVTGLPLTAGLADEGAVHLDSIDKPVAIFAELEALTALREELTRRTVHLAAMVAAQTAAGPGAADVWNERRRTPTFSAIGRHGARVVLRAQIDSARAPGPARLL